MLTPWNGFFCKSVVVASFVMLVVVSANAGDNPSSSVENLNTIEEGKLTVGSDIPYPPFEIRDNGQVTGFDIELVKEIAKNLDLEVEIIDTPFDTIFTQLAGGRFDVVVAAVGITDARKKSVDFTMPYFQAPATLTINKEETQDVKSVDDLKEGDVVAVQSGSTGKQWAQAHLAPRGIKLRSFADGPAAYQALSAGTVKGTVEVLTSANKAVERSPMLKIVDQMAAPGTKWGIAVKKGNDNLREAINQQLKNMMSDGRYDDLMKKYDLPESGAITPGVDDVTGQ